MMKDTGRPGDRFKHGLLALLASAIGLVPVAGHSAGVLSGHFNGTAFDSEFYVPPFGDFDNSRIPGSFLIDLSGCVAGPEPVPFPGACLASEASFLTAVIPGQSSTYGQPQTLVEVSNTPDTQRLSIIFGFTNPYSGARLELVGGTNAFIIGTDFSSLHPGTVDLAGSTLTLMGGRTYRARVALSSFTFDQSGAAVPDAPTWALLLAGFTMIGVAGRVGQRRSTPTLE
ncbi:hypothetical protein [Glacieibacterium sp.]|uniref:hypothetical protein n=1 Tax=Glacieibacterium sp. TaxID=2860237 RepID=UPI003AFFE071